MSHYLRDLRDHDLASYGVRKAVSLPALPF